MNKRRPGSEVKPDAMVHHGRLINVLITDEMREKIQEVALAQGKSSSAVIRDAIDSYLFEVRKAQLTEEIMPFNRLSGV
jgi:predicted DNA-binding protein